MWTYVVPSPLVAHHQLFASFSHCPPPLFLPSASPLPVATQAELLIIEKEVDDIFQEIQFQMKRDKALQERSGTPCNCCLVTGTSRAVVVL
jgi:hypothetical protein